MVAISCYIYHDRCSMWLTILTPMPGLAELSTAPGLPGKTTVTCTTSCVVPHSFGIDIVKSMGKPNHRYNCCRCRQS